MTMGRDSYGRVLRPGLGAVVQLCFVFLVVGLSSVPAPAGTVEFVEGKNGYSSTVDVFLRQNPAGATRANGAEQSAGWQDRGTAIIGSDAHALIRFDDIIGSDGNQIPSGARITEAKLLLTVFDAGDTGVVHEVRLDWDETDTHRSFCGVACQEGFHYGSAIGEVSAETVGEVEIDVTASVQAWADGAANHGWIIRSRSDSTSDGVAFRSSESGIRTERPRLSVSLRDCPPETEVTLSLSQLTVSPGETVVAEVVATPANGLAYDITIEYDPAVVDAVSVSNTPLSQDHLLFSNTSNPGIIYISLFGTVPLTGSGPILEIEFSVIGDFGDQTALTFTQAMVDEGAYITCAIDGSIDICVPIEVAGVMAHAGTPTRLSWSDPGAGVVFDVAGGLVQEILQDQGSSGAQCLADDEPLASFEDTRPDPAPSECHYYLVRSQNACGTGPYGQTSSGAPRLPVNDCP
jgi:hypothetical protein